MTARSLPMTKWLVAQRERVLARMFRLRARHGRLEAHRGIEAEADVGDLVDRAQRHENDDVVGDLTRLADDELPALERALSRIDGGTYQDCIRCGDVIPKARLERLPATMYCVACAHAHETRS